MDKKILLIGGGGHCKSVLDSLLNSNEYCDIGIIDRKENVGKQIMGVTIIGSDDDLLDIYSKGYQYAFITLGSVGNPALRIKLYNNIKIIGFKIPNIIDSTACVSKYAHIESGVFIGKHAIVNAGAVVNNCSIVNTGAIVEHDCIIGEFVHIAPGAVLSGGVKVGNHSHIGSNATVKQQVQIGASSIIGMGSVVVKDVGEAVMAFGNPCREVKKL
ncbi:acetyltransferase [Acetivibrio clariflavus]|uniref:PglD N-terminal domain-containing protein n=1 Tax=Acetivibrio clariflavus (strain DSM 19732 / NBRC 101661 / EBR45) TaxID=720554 RepID=G8LUG2_ACECE|nr:acetyltransferase [Acetivibrio clariflavus]AEV70610.1 hypothetical protein Clocl_4181 [Acetivibrio clariflavus DSM 19732]